MEINLHRVEFLFVRLWLLSRIRSERHAQQRQVSLFFVLTVSFYPALVELFCIRLIAVFFFFLRKWTIFLNSISAHWRQQRGRTRKKKRITYFATKKLSIIIKKKIERGSFFFSFFFWLIRFTPFYVWMCWQWRHTIIDKNHLGGFVFVYYFFFRLRFVCIVSEYLASMIFFSFPSLICYCLLLNDCLLLSWCWWWWCYSYACCLWENIDLFVFFFVVESKSVLNSFRVLTFSWFFNCYKWYLMRFCLSTPFKAMEREKWV